MKPFSLWCLIGIALTLSLSPYRGRAAEDECVMGLEALEPLLDTKAGSIQKVLTTKKDLKERRLTESVLLKDGVTVTYSVGGCAHYGYSLRYENVGQIPTKEPQAIEAALRLLQKTPVLQKSEGPYPLVILMDALKQTKGSANKFQNGELPLNCGEADCWIEVKEKTLTVKYDFAL